jgi:hypothetical protein
MIRLDVVDGIINEVGNETVLRQMYRTLFLEELIQFQNFSKSINVDWFDLRSSSVGLGSGEELSRNPRTVEVWTENENSYRRCPVS